MNENLANLIGFAGTACIIFAYAYSTARATPNPFVQHGVNLLGAALLSVILSVPPLETPVDDLPIVAPRPA